MIRGLQRSRVGSEGDDGWRGSEEMVDHEGNGNADDDKGKRVTGPSLEEWTASAFLGAGGELVRSHAYVMIP